MSVAAHTFTGAGGIVIPYMRRFDRPLPIPPVHRRSSLWPLRVALLVVFGLIIASAHAQIRQYTFHPVGTEYGLSQNTPNAIVQDPLGFIWIATGGGLNRFDGNQYRVFRHGDNQDSIPENQVTTLAIDGTTLWMGFRSQYIARMDVRDGRVQRYLHPGVARRTPLTPIRALLAQDHKLWIAVEGGVDVLDTATGVITEVLPHDPVNDAGAQGLAFDAGGRLLLARGRELLHIEHGKAKVIATADAPIFRLLRDHEGALWVAGENGLYRLGRRDALEKAWPLATHPALPDAPNLTALVEAPDGALWLATAEQGLVRYLPADGSATRIVRQTGVPGTLQENSFTSLLVDGGGTLWIGGSYLGPMHTHTNGDRFPYIYSLGGDRERDLRVISIRGMAQDTAGNAWIATDDSRLVRMSPSLPPVFTEFTDALRRTFPEKVRRSNAPARIFQFIPKSDTAFWVATSHGLASMDTRDGRFEEVDLPLDNHMVTDIARDARGRLYLGVHRRGLYRYDPADGSLVAFALPGDRTSVEKIINAILIDRQGLVWVGSNGGLMRLDPRSGRMQRWYMSAGRDDSLASNSILSLVQDRHGTIWLGTMAGLNRVLPKAGDGLAFTSVLTGLAGLETPPTVFSILEGPAGYLWLGTDSGLLRYDQDRAQVERYSTEQGLQAQEFNTQAALRLRDGRLMMGGVRGINLFDPRSQQPKPTLAPLQVIASRVGNEAWNEWPLDAAGGLRHLALADPDQTLRIRAQRMDFGGFSRTRYRYRLIPHDSRWTDNGTLDEFAYGRLPAGDYQLQIQATDRRGDWGSDILTIPVHVATAWWRTRSMIALYAVLASLIALAVLLTWTRRRAQEKRLNQATRERETRLNLALWGASESFWDYDIESNRLTVSYNPNEDSTERVTHAVRIHPDDEPLVLARLRRYLNEGAGGTLTSQHRVSYADREWHWVSTRGRAVKWDAQGDVQSISGTARDVTARLAAEHAQRIAIEVFQNMAEAVTVLDEGFRIVSTNDAFSTITGYPGDALAGEHIDLLFGSEQARTAADIMQQRLIAEGQWTGELWHRHRNGHDFLCKVQATLVTQSTLAVEGNDIHYVLVLGDVTEQRRAEQELRQLANYDPLTELPNRSLFNRRLAEAIASHRNGRQFAVMFLDLDRFKDINDSLGHSIGDQVLRATAERLRGITASEQLVARLGGDEFTVIVPRMESPQDTYRVAREILAGFARPLTLENGLEFAISPSIGISVFPDDGIDADTLVRQADTAMYQAKADGRQMYRRYHPDMDAQAIQRLRMSTLLRGATERGETWLVYQPRWCLRTGVITGVEALLRWRHPELGDVAPDVFIPLAEDTGLINALGTWVANEACRDLAEWDAAGLPSVKMGINVSAAQLMREDFPGFITRCADVRGIAPDRIELEITESVLMERPQLAGELLQRLRAIGIQIAIDDFGTGYSSLAYLRGLPVNTLKIDRAFVSDLAHDPRDEAIIIAIITMAHSMGMKVVAEGVETEAQLAQLRRHGCDEAQGFLLARPMEAADCRAFLQRHASRRLDHPPAP